MIMLLVLRNNVNKPPVSKQQQLLVCTCSLLLRGSAVLSSEAVFGFFPEYKHVLLWDLLKQPALFVFLREQSEAYAVTETCDLGVMTV